MREYRIAFLTTDWNYEVVESALRGLKRYIDEHENVRLCVFDCFGKETDTARDNLEYSIFNLVEPADFDGILVQSNQIVLQSMRNRIAEAIARAGIPAVTINCPLPGCTLVEVKNEAPQRDLVSHVIREHGARRLAYLTGILEQDGSPEGIRRLEGFMSACRENGIPESDIELIHGTWRGSDGTRTARRWLREGKPLPDAFICANDDMALGLMNELRRGGVNVPEDVIVTGFDNLSSAELSTPRLSTVDRDYAGLDYLAMEVLIAKIEGRETRDCVSRGYEVVLSESCGCSETARPSAVREKYYNQTLFLKNFYALQDRMASELFNVSDLPELMATVQRNHRIFGCERVYLCVNDYYFDNYDHQQWHPDTQDFGREMVLAPGSGRKDCVRFPTRELLPDGLTRQERFLAFYPLHYNAYSIGYLAMNGVSEAARLNLHESILTFLEIAIENVRRKALLHSLNVVLDSLYVHDALTGLYNRFGFERFAQEAYERFLRENGGAQVLFVDMDDMKGINDRHGHDIGDAAILATGNLLKKVCGDDDFLMRYGGDEFLIIAPSSEEQLTEAILRAAEQDGQRAGMPFRLSLSIGTIPVDTSDGRTLIDCIRDADALMYRDKQRHKR